MLLCFQFGIRIQLSVSVWFGFKWRDRIDDHNFDLISITIDRFWSFFDQFWLKDQKNHLNADYLITNSQSYKKYIKFDQKMSKTTGFLINLDIFDQIWSIFDINKLFWYKSDKI